ncbi:hypothetical protein [Verrucosispora sp. SN26_14.1]|uniref:hypothetical protein n=1 Tax=Verrucosispora sp. SN26_14.1 TaxID=2527879 RepID=UPI001F252708|nr:hypothetical protein [Verrucosispora sp. SN26_14.1]
MSGSPHGRRLRRQRRGGRSPWTARPCAAPAPPIPQPGTFSLPATRPPAWSCSTGIDLPHAVQALQVRRRRHRLDQPKRFTTETVYAITDLRVHQAKPAQLASWIRNHWSIENKVHWVRDVTYDEDRSQIRIGTGPQVMAALRTAAIGALRTAGVTNIAAAGAPNSDCAVDRPVARRGA